jgi:ligand-binding SRPBCC domain-containing protein
MKVYLLRQEQFLPVSLTKAWVFFSNPENLAEITPATMAFQIQHISGAGQMYPGQLISYRIRIFPWVWVDWLTEITQVKEGTYFIDDQRFGPYAFWHHQHFFRAVAGGVEMVDEITYGLPFGWIGRLAHSLFVKKQLKTIFAHRYKVLEERFKNNSAQIRVSA